MWRSGGRTGIRRLFSSSSAAARRHPKDEGDWCYASEWWGTGSDGHTVFRSTSDHGNGVVSVVAYPSSRPDSERWLAREEWLRERYTKIHPESEHDVKFKILGYQWRTLRFNDNTRQSTVKIMASCIQSDPASLYLMQQPYCIAVPYMKSMVSTGLTALASSSFDLHGAVTGKRSMKVLCVGHGGGSLPLFLASKIKGATVHVVEIDPIVVSASIQAMGFPASAVREIPDRFSSARPADSDQLLYGDASERLFLFRLDAEDFVVNNQNIYDLVFIDAYDGDDIFPHKLWEPNGQFMRSLQNMLHPVHGTIVVNLHSDSDVLDSEMTGYRDLQSILPMGKYVSQVCRAYKEHIGMAFTFSVPWLCNITLVACNGVGLGSGAKGVSVNRRDWYLNSLVSKSRSVELLLDLPFPCLQYIKTGFTLVD